MTATTASVVNGTEPLLAADEAGVALAMLAGLALVAGVTLRAAIVRVRQRRG